MAAPAGNTFEIDTCKDCGAEVIWTRTVNNKWMPVNKNPSKEGQVTLQDNGKEPPLAMYHTIKGRGVTYYVPHFATCPNRKKNK